MKSKKVFVVKNFKSPYIEEAIFILREDTPSSSAVLPDAVSEAERIITGYLESLEPPRPPKKKMCGKLVVSTLAVLSLAALLLLLFF